MVPAPYMSNRARIDMIAMMILVYDLGVFTGGLIVSVIHPPLFKSDPFVPYFTRF
jgi:hypothetical protein